MFQLLFALITLLCIALVFVVYPLRQNLKTAFVLVILFSTLSIGFYGLWGGYSGMEAERLKKEQMKLAESELKKYTSPQDVIARLNSVLKERPESAEGWYLLGRLYSTQSDFKKASGAFKKAYALDHKDLKIRLAMMQALYMENGGEIKGNVKSLLDDILKESPEQLDALNFIANNAYNHHDYPKALRYLQRLLTHLPQEGKEYEMMVNAISAIQKKIKEGEQHG